jgi:hypothetical protein
LAEENYDTSQLASEEEARRLYVVAWLSDLGYDPAQLEVDTSYARRAAVREWLRSRDWNPDEVFPDNPDTLLKSRWQAMDPKAIEICVREWYAAMLEKHDLLLPAGVKGRSDDDGRAG